MKLSRHRSFTVRMREYENYTFGARVECDHNDLGLSDDDVRELDEEGYAQVWGELAELVITKLEEAVVGEVREVGTLTEDDESYILKALKPRPKARRK